VSFPKQFLGYGSELSSIACIANALAAWLDIHLREPGLSLVRED